MSSRQNLSPLEFRQFKWRTWFKMLDRNEDGMLTDEDWKLIGEKFVKDGHLTGEDAELVRKTFIDWGKMIHGLGSNGAPEITEEQFITNFTQFYAEDPELAKRATVALMEKLVDVSDVDHDGYITEDEFVLKNCPFGWTEKQSRDIFALVPGTHHGRRGVARSCITDYCVEFVIGEDREAFRRIEAMLPANAD